MTRQLTILSYLLILSLSLSLNAEAQIKVITPGVYQWIGGEPVMVEPAGSEDLSGTVIDREAENMDGENLIFLWMVNETNEEITVKIIRTELDVTPQTMDIVTWGLHFPFYLTAGEEPVWVVGGGSTAFTETLAPGDTVYSFDHTIWPNNQEGCSLYRVEMLDNETLTELYTSFDIRWDHSPIDCATALDEYPAIETRLYPNPTSGITALNITGIDRTVDIRITNLLGQSISKEQFNPLAADRYLIETIDMVDGIYFISIQDERQVLKTIKLVVKH